MIGDRDEAMRSGEKYGEEAEAMGDRDETTKTAGKQDGEQRIGRGTLLKGAGALLVVGALPGAYA